MTGITAKQRAFNPGWRHSTPKEPTIIDPKAVPTVLLYDAEGNAYPIEDSELARDCAWARGLNIRPPARRDNRK